MNDQIYSNMNQMIYYFENFISIVNENSLKKINYILDNLDNYA